MGSDNFREWKRSPCSFCGKEQGGMMGSSCWTHRFMCCSEECGKALGEALKENENTREYQDALQKSRIIQQKLWLVRRRGLKHLPLHDP